MSMEPNDIYSQRIPANSSSSAIDLSGTSTGLASILPSSPSLVITSDNRKARRRTSWGRVNTGQDPLRLDLASGSTNLDRHPSGSTEYMVGDDPFYSPTDDVSYPNVQRTYPGRHENEAGTYSTAQSGPSTASLMTRHEFDMDGGRDDDEAHLTANMAHGDMWGQDDGEDPERSGGTPGSRRRALRYGASPSPLKKTGTALKRVSHNLRRVSLRVVNLAGAGLEHQIRLPDDDRDEVQIGKEDDREEEEELPDLTQNLPIRGRTLGFLGPKSRIRIALFNFLVYPWTEPVILVLIIINAVVLTIQASRSITLPATNDPSSPSLPPTVSGYFHSWEDHALFVLFIIFTLEAFARICVSGFLLDPDIPLSSLFSSPFSAYADASRTSTSTTSNSFISRQPSLTRPQGPLTSGISFTQRLDYLGRNLARPFSLSQDSVAKPKLGRNRSDTVQSTTPMAEKSQDEVQGAHAPVHDHSHPVFLSNALRSDRTDLIALPFRLSIIEAHDKTQRNVPYLRHSWSRIDFVAIVSFWVSFALATAGLERGKYHIGLFRAMSVIRTARLLTITSGTTTIMHSLKTARPMLTSVAYFVLFAMVLFSIIGVQSFKGSLRRSCYLAPTLGEDETQLSSQFCGGYIDPVTLNETSYILLDGRHALSAKGYICPLGQVCKEEENPNNNVESFDTIYYAALQVVIVASANGWSPLMYNTIDSEFFISCLFFIVCIIVLNFWLINLFVAVITNTFSAIRSETKKSAFGAAPLATLVEDHDDGWADGDGRKTPRSNIAKIICDYTGWAWVFLALASLVLQATGNVDVSASHQMLMDYGELGITVAFDVEIILRFLATLPDWRSFFSFGQNWLDLALAIGSSIIQVPVIHHSAVYPWFTIFQLARFYRVILVVPRMKPLLLAVFGNMYGLANMSLFLLLVNYIAALVAVQLMRGDYPQGTTMNFGQLFTSFLAMYQVFTSENWTNVLYGATNAEIALGQTVVVALFISSWFLFANFIVMQMFIAVINENFDIAEESKKGQQASNYWATHQPQDAKTSWMRKFNPYRWVKANPVKLKVENLPPNLVLPMQKSLVQDYSLARKDSRIDDNKSASDRQRGPGHYSSKSLTALQRLFAGPTKADSIPMSTFKHTRGETVVDPHDEETERHLELLATFNSEAARSEDVSDALHERRAQKADFIRYHPSYDKTFWIFSQKNLLRQFCQKLVQPVGERIYGISHSPIGHPIFQLVILLAVIGGIAVEGVATPIYRRNFFQTSGLVRFAWFDICEMAFGFTLVVEFLIKIIADGFAFTPNAYLRSIWNVLDLLILIGILVNLTTTLIFIGGLSRFTRSLKALRALRLITLIDKMRDTFQSLIISGAMRIVDAAVLAILYMIPYAVWGLNIFSGKMNECNDNSNSINSISDCTNEYTNTVYGNSFGFLVPRVWNNPAPSTVFSFDTFRASLLILFEIVSLEGWIDVMGVATSIVGEGQQPQTNASQVNAIFFLIYNLLGGVVILTLFVSIIIGNFKSKTGSAFLTTPQREWIDLQKLFKRQKPSKRPKTRPTWPIRAWCFDCAVRKHGWWSRAMSFLFILHIIALMTQTFTIQSVADLVRNDFFLAIIFVYIIDTLIRLFGLGWNSFRGNRWNLFDIFIAGGSFITTIVVRFGSSALANDFLIEQLQKLFLVSIAFKLVQRNNGLNKLFKTAVASLPAILSLLGLWIILFFFFAILYVEVFSMTKWSTAEGRNINYSSFGSSLVMLAFMSTGEGWNQYMHDFALVYPRCTDPGNQLDSDCGSIGWAFSLFIAWNLLSMYIFVNIFTGVVVENFSYVFQTSVGGAKAITREEMRAFKKVWGEFANPKTGYLERSRFVPFFAKLSGAFEVRIYPLEYRLPNIIAACKEATDSDHSWPTRVVDGIDLNKLNRVLSTVDYSSIRKRRALYSRLYHEASISHEPGRGISFTNMLMLLAHHKIIVDREALILNDLVQRTETNKLVTDLVNLDRVRSLLKMISLRRRFLAHLERQRLDQEIPSIVVETLSETPGSSRDIASARFDSTSPGYALNSPSPPDGRYQSPNMSIPPLDLSPGSGLHRSRRASDISMLSADIGYRSNRDSSFEEDPQNILSSMQNSQWGEMMLKAEKEDEKYT